MPYKEKNMIAKLRKVLIKSLKVVFLFIAPAITIYCGIYYLDDRKYYFISLLLIIYALIAFLMRFEKREPKLRELMMIAVLAAIGIAGRMAFYMLPQFKPVLAVVIIAGIGLDASAGFLVGVLIAFLSNFFFGQGPWTPWQMFAMGLVGYSAGIIFAKSLLPKKKLTMSIFGFVITFLIYGAIMNFSSVMVFQAEFSFQALLTSYALGFPFDLILAVATFIFLYILGEPMLEKIERIKIKYGLL